MSRSYRSDGYDNGSPEYHARAQPPSQRLPPAVYSQSQGPRDRQYPMHPSMMTKTAPPMYDFTPRPTRQREQQQQQQYYNPQSRWEDSQEMYDSNGYGHDGYEYAYDYDYDDGYGHYGGQAYDQGYWDGHGYDEYAHHDQWPSQQDHWPLPVPTQPQINKENSPRRPPPQRPQRPDEVQSLSREKTTFQQPRAAPQTPPSASRGNQSSHHGSGQWTGDGYSYTPPAYQSSKPSPSRPTPSPSIATPIGLPEYHTPRQAVYGQANQRPPLGPPPSARRAPSSFYPQVGPVHPILEESESMRGSTRAGSVQTGSLHNGSSDHISKTSLASSNAIPIGIQQAFLDNEAPPRVRRPDLMSEYSEYSLYESPIAPPPNVMWNGQNDRPAQDDTAKQEVGIARQESFGKRSRPILRDVKSSDKLRSSIEQRRVSKENHRASDEHHHTSSDHHRTEYYRTNSAQGQADVQRARAKTQEKLEGQSSPGAIDPDDSPPADNSISKPHAFKPPTPEPTQPLPSLPPKAITRPSPRTDTSSFSNPRKSSSRTSLIPTRTTSPPPASNPKLPNPGFSTSMADRRRGSSVQPNPIVHQPPSDLDVDAVRNAEARGSLSSLSDLIRRATRLASNLDRGRTASRLGIAWMMEGGAGGGNGGDRRDEEEGEVGPADEKRALEERPPSRGKRFSGFVDGGGHSRGGDEKVGEEMGYGRSGAMGGNGNRRMERRRRVCGMSMGVFLLMMILLVMLVVAAVVVPVMLVVVRPGG